MTARVLGVLALATVAALMAPLWLDHDEPDQVAALSVASAAPARSIDPVPALPSPAQPLVAAVQRAVEEHIPGVHPDNWVLHSVDRSEPGINGSQRIVAHGVVTAVDSADTQVRLVGRYDPRTGALSRVRYQLEASAPARDAAAVATSAWSVQHAVQDALAAAQPGQKVVFALDSAQSLRLEDGGRRFEGAGIGVWNDGDAQFVAFTLVLSPDGLPLAFDYGTPTGDELGLAVR